MHQQMVLRDLKEPEREAAAASDPLKEELTPPKEEITGPPSQSEEESIMKTLASGHPERETENMEPKQAECDERATDGCQDLLEDCVPEATGESIPTETVKPRPLEDVTSSFQSEVQLISLADEAVSPASKTKLEGIETIDGEPSKILVSVSLTACPSESFATGLISSQAIGSMAAEEICVQEELVSEGTALVALPEESISSENTANRDSGGPNFAENFTELALDPLLDPPKEPIQVMKPVGTQDQEEEKTEYNQRCSAPLGAEPMVSSPDRTRSEAITDTSPDGADNEEEEEEEEAELDDKVRKKKYKFNADFERFQDEYLSQYDPITL